MRMVADIGGTNTRLALSEHGVIVPGTFRSSLNDDWPQFYDLLAAYLADHSPTRLTDIVVAVAGPVDGDRARLTNRDWTICAADLVRSTGCDSAVLLNDLTALGNAVPTLSAPQLRQFHSGPEKRTGVAQSLVVGLGTGFNASPVVYANGVVQCLNVEAGHVPMPLSIAAMLEEEFGRPSQFSTVEALFSGRGFTAFCRQICSSNALEGIDVISSYGCRDGELATSAVDRYSALLGQLLRELALAYMPNSGIYLAGSVARAIMDVAPLRCINAYTKPCNIRTGDAPDLFTITDDGAALFGCATIG